MLSDTSLIQIFSCVFGFIVMPLGMFVCKKLYDKIKSEEHKEKGKVVQIIIKNHCLIQMVSWPTLYFLGIFILINNTTTQSVDSAEKLNAIHVLRGYYHFFRIYLSFHSLVVAVTRYVFVMYDIQTEIFGVQRLKKLFVFASIGVPVIHTIVYEALCPFEAVWLSLFVVHNDSVSVVSEQNSISYAKIMLDEEYNIEVYNIINEYLPSPIIFGIRIVQITFFILNSLNIAEGFLYTHVFIHFNRWNNT